jgi:hypothetical protein
MGVFLWASMIVANSLLFMGLLICGVNLPVTLLPSFLQPIV